MSDESGLERALSVVQALHRRTQEGKVEWEESPTYGPGFEADFGELGVVILKIDDPDDPKNPDYSLLIIDKEPGRIIENISNNTLRPVMDRTTKEGLNPYLVLSDTFRMARRKALKIDDVLDDLLEKLEGPS